MTASDRDRPSPPPERDPDAAVEPRALLSAAGIDRWQRAEIEAALAEADAGDFADPDEVAAAFRPR